MKKINTITRKVTLATSILFGTLLFSSTIANANPTNKNEEKKEATSEATIVEAEVMDYLENEDSFVAMFKALNAPTVKVFDKNDALIFSGKVADLNNIKDKKVLSVIHKSDFLMQLDNTAYYKLQQ